MRKGTLRKIVALGTGAVMLGATIFGAAAQADVGAYPAQYIKDGKFDGNIVVGAKASTEDVLGSIELAASLQTAAVKNVEIPGAATTFTVDKESVQVKRTGRSMALTDSIRDVFGASISESKLPILLKDGTFKDKEGDNKGNTDYTQTLDFVEAGTENTFFEFRAANDMFDDAADAYVWIDDAENVYEYVLDFDTPITFDDAADLEGNVLEIQGNLYTITSVRIDGADVLTRVELLAGETKVWLTQGEPLKRNIAGTEHTVVLMDVNENEDKCGITVDGTTLWIDDGQVETVNGVEIGVTDAIVVHSAGKDTDVCEVNVGATKILLEDGAEVKINDVSLDNSDTDVYNDNANEWDGFALTYQLDDELYLVPGTGEDSLWVDPVLGNWQINFASVTRRDEVVEWSRSGNDDATLKLNNIDGKDVEIAWHYDDGSGLFVLGNDCDELMLLEGDSIDYAAETDLEGQMLFFVAPGDEIHILEISDVDVGNDKIDLKDLTYGKTYNDLDFTWGGGAQDIQMTGMGTISLDDDGATLLADDLVDGAANAFTMYEHTLVLDSAGDGPIAYTDLACTDGYNDIVFDIEEDGDTLESGAANDAVWTMEGNWDGVGNEIDFIDPAVASSNDVTDVFDKSDSADTTSMMATEYGSIAEWDNDDNRDGKLMLPEEQITAQVFIAKTGATVVAGGATAVQFQQIQVGTAKLDTDISDVAAQNLLVVGGPCANSVAATLMGNPADCTEGFVEGEAILKMFEQSNGNVALLVAGYSALDTRRAAKVLANYKDYSDKLSGSEVKVTGTTLSDISVEMVA